MKLRKLNLFIPAHRSYPSLLAWISAGWVNYAIMAIITILRPLLGPAECKYGLSCMRFARKQLQELPLHKALCRILRRVISCSPWAQHQEDLMI